MLRRTQFKNFAGFGRPYGSCLPRSFDRSDFVRDGGRIVITKSLNGNLPAEDRGDHISDILGDHPAADLAAQAAEHAHRLASVDRALELYHDALALKLNTRIESQKRRAAIEAAKEDRRQLDREQWRLEREANEKHRAEMHRRAQEEIEWLAEDARRRAAEEHEPGTDEYKKRHLELLREADEALNKRNVEFWAKEAARKKADAEERRKAEVAEYEARKAERARRAEQARLEELRRAEQYATELLRRGEEARERFEREQLERERLERERREQQARKATEAAVRVRAAELDRRMELRALQARLQPIEDELEKRFSKPGAWNSNRAHADYAQRKKDS